jgi:hypothetical protein
MRSLNVLSLCLFAGALGWAIAAHQRFNDALALAERATHRPVRLRGELGSRDGSYP